MLPASGSLTRREEKFKAAIKLARKQPDCSAIVVLIDAEEDCPAIYGPQLLKWGREQVGDFPIAVVLAKHAYESWLIASYESLRDHGRLLPDADIDFRLIHRRSASFRKLWKDVGLLIGTLGGTVVSLDKEELSQT